MLFNSLAFLIFFPTVFSLYYAIPKKWQLLLLLLASCVFYMAFVPSYILILFFLITLDFFLAQIMVKKTGSDRKLFLVLSLLANLSFLFIFKYFNFFNINLASLANLLHWNYSLKLLQIALPLGLSFHIFQSLSYIIEVYRGKYLPEQNYLRYSLYVLFFPQMVAGPIERPYNLLPQFIVEHNFNAQQVRQGLERMLWGFFKKLIIADWLSVLVNNIYNQPQDFSGWPLIIATIAFAFQIYCDFSGYTDIALGAAQVLGYRLIENFNRPYAARSIADFWKRWHMSLSSWFRDYLYIPLGGNRVTKSRRYFNLLLVFLLSGLWHGANWTFLIWGFLHGLYLILELVTKSLKERLLKFFQLIKFPKLLIFLELLMTFSLVNIAWIFFRAGSSSDAFYILSKLTSNFSNIFNISYLRYELFTPQVLGLSRTALALLVLAIIVMELVQYQQAKHKTFYIFDRHPVWLRYTWYYGLLFVILFLGYSAHEAKTFIYFQF